MKKTLLALALIGASSTAMADSWIYAGASGGSADWDNSSDTSTAVSVHVGTGILPFIGLEAGYNDFGEVGGLSASSVYFAAKPSIDFGPLHVYAKGGLHKWETKLGRETNDDVDMMYGVGAEYFIMGPFSVGANYMNYTLDNTDIGVLSISGTFHFL